MKKITLLAIIVLMTLPIGGLSAQIRSDYRQKVMSWTRTASRIDNRFFTLYTDEAKRIADNLVLYQLDSGAWPKNIYFPGEITDEQRKEIANNKKRLGSGTIDNGSTTTEIIYLSKVYNVTREKKYKQAT